LSAALKTVALKDCGGTLTIRTRLASGGDGQKFGPEVVYENVYEENTRTVATSAGYPAGTFDFDLEGASLTTSATPQVSSALAGYRLDRWDCRAGPADIAESQVPITGNADFQGVQVSIPANAAVSCTMWIEPKT
jgi:hypothetical protein